MNLKKIFLKFCEDNHYEINQSQLEVIQNLKKYYSINFHKNFFDKFFKKKEVKLGFYLVGDVGVGKTMILNFFYDEIENKKLRLHFNEFMIRFHNSIFKNKDKEKGIDNFVKDLSRNTEILYFDEFQVTNIVDAMILGRLFKKIFEEKIKVIFSSNIKIDDLYKDGLQRDQFIPFIKILKNNCFEKELFINEDYRSSRNKNLERYLSPINNSANFMFNKISLENFFDGVVRFNFDELCNRNLGSEDYIEIANASDFIFLENLPDFNENNSNQQQRFISLIDIIYEKKIPMMITSEIELNLIKSSKNLIEPFKRTISRLYELTSINYN